MDFLTRIFQVFWDWLTFRFSQKRHDYTLAGESRVRSKALGAIQHGQHGVQNKLHQAKHQEEDDD